MLHPVLLVNVPVRGAATGGVFLCSRANNALRAATCVHIGVRGGTCIVCGRQQRAAGGAAGFGAPRAQRPLLARLVTAVLALLVATFERRGTFKHDATQLSHIQRLYAKPVRDTSLDVYLPTSLALVRFPVACGGSKCGMYAPQVNSTAFRACAALQRPCATGSAVFVAARAVQRAR